MRNGIGIEEHASVELAGIKGLWALRSSSAAEHDSLLVLSFLSETRVLSLGADEGGANPELEEATLPGFDQNAKTLACANLTNNLLVQVTASRVSLASCEGPRALASWQPPAGSAISVAAADGEDIVLALSSPPALVLLRASESAGLVQVATIPLDNEASSLALSAPTYGRAGLPDGAKPDEARVVAVGLWYRMDVLLFSLPALEQALAEPLKGEVMARSLVFVTLARTTYLLCGMGDGHVLSFVYDAAPAGSAPTLRERKSVPLGTQPVQLTPFSCNGTRHVFCASDRPTVLSASAYKLLYANVNLGETAHMSPFTSAAFPEALALATEAGLTIGSMDNLQKLHVRTVELREHPRRIAHDETSRCYAVCTVQQLPFDSGAAGSSAAHAHTLEEAGREINHVRLMDDSTFEIVDTHTLHEGESAEAVRALTLTSAETGASVRAFVVGTAYVDADEPEPTKGRILMLAVTDGRLSLVAEAQTKGAVYSLCELRGRIVAGVNNRIELYDWEEASGGLGVGPGGQLRRQEQVHYGNILALFIEVRSDFILVGDLMKSVSLHLYSPETGTITDLARDYNSNWLRAISILDDDTFLAAESSCNLFVVRKNSDATTDEERQRLEVCAEFHLGEHVNRFRQGSLTMQLTDGESAPLPTLLFGTVDGVIGVIATIPEEVRARSQCRAWSLLLPSCCARAFALWWAGLVAAGYD